MSRINTNINAIQSMIRLNKNTADLSVHLSRLSTGLRINSGKDDPAGLIASENLRSEMAGINQAIDNSTRAGSVISTAEGALNEVSSLLLDLKSLINNASNSGALAPEELEANQAQIDSAVNSINRIANSTAFEGVKLLNGNMDFITTGVDAGLKDLHIDDARFGAATTVDVDITVNSAATQATSVFTGATAGNNVTIELTTDKGVETFTFTSGVTNSGMRDAINQSKDVTGVSAVVSGTALKLTRLDYGSNPIVSVKAISGTFATVETDGTDANVLVNGIKAVADGRDIKVSSSSISFEASLGTSLNQNATSTSFSITGGGAQFQLGPSVNAQQMAVIGIGSVAAHKLGSADNGYLYQLMTQGDYAILNGDTDNVQQADKIVSDAISQVANMRGRLGAFQKNVLTTNINSLNVSLENVTASESAIRDADFAKETAAMTRAQILVQAGTSVLAIANSAPQNVLSLLGR